MPTDFKFDPVTRDIISDGKGSFVQTETAETTVLHQLTCLANASWHDENLGTKLVDLQAYPQNAPAKWALDEAKRALGVLVSRGRIANVEVATEEHPGGRIAIATQFRDVSTGGIVNTLVKAGG